MNLVNNNIRLMDSTGTLVIKPNHVNSDDITINASFPHYDYNQASDLSFEANIIELKKFKELDMASIRLAEDLHKLLGILVNCQIIHLYVIGQSSVKKKSIEKPSLVIWKRLIQHKIFNYFVVLNTSSLTELSDEFKKIAKRFYRRIYFYP
ncbi:hypothetical protein RIR_jg19581.t1 [Rhizophagus irregularis DAOM 181602=DAOM 197198]|nr:hypothetical protein RIR_jg19581.t1 [Rhizophagus irregularis DAOM 181602=DAOM 197198]